MSRRLVFWLLVKGTRHHHCSSPGSNSSSSKMREDQGWVPGVEWNGLSEHQKERVEHVPLQMPGLVAHRRLPVASATARTKFQRCRRGAQRARQELNTDDTFLLAPFCHDVPGTRWIGSQPVPLAPRVSEPGQVRPHL